VTRVQVLGLWQRALQFGIKAMNTTDWPFALSLRQLAHPVHLTKIQIANEAWALYSRTASKKNSETHDFRVQAPVSTKREERKKKKLSACRGEGSVWSGRCLLRARCRCYTLLVLYKQNKQKATCC
jgi:hypothetical protein